MDIWLAADYIFSNKKIFVIFLNIFFAGLRDLDIWSATGFSSAHVESVARPHIIPIHSTHHSDRIDWYVCTYIVCIFMEIYILYTPEVWGPSRPLGLLTSSFPFGC